MKIEQNKSELVITSIEEIGYKYLHIIFDVEFDSILHSNITNNISVFNDLKDGYFKIYEIKLNDSSDNKNNYISDNCIYDKNNNIITALDLLNDENQHKTVIDFFNKYNLKNCYINILKNLLSSCSPCNDNNNKGGYIKDLLFIGLEVIEYLLEHGMYNSAAQVLNQLKTCGYNDPIYGCKVC